MAGRSNAGALQPALAGVYDNTFVRNFVVGNGEGGFNNNLFFNNGTNIFTQ